MYRKIIEDLINWKNSKRRKPLIFKGARQVGKTWILKEFGNKYYEKFAYINLDSNENMRLLFEGDYDIERILLGLKIESGVNIEPGNTLIVLDEVQEVPRAINALKYFCENANEYHIIVSGSLLGIALHSGISFPVGKVNRMEMYPMTFNEFLMAIGEEQIAKLLNANDINMINNFKYKIIDLLKNYYFVGGMPEAVAEFAENKNFKIVRDIQNEILKDYMDDFSKHAPASIVPRIRLVFNSIISQLSKENKKFIYGVVKEGARAREYETAIEWLINSGLFYKVSRVNNVGVPINKYEDLSSFKLYFLDVGLLGCMGKLDDKTILTRK